MMRRQLALVLTVAAGCGSPVPLPTSPPGPPPDPPPSAADLEGLWTGSAGSSAILRLAPGQLVLSGDLEPASTLTTPSTLLSTLFGIAFDSGGTLWVSSADYSALLAFSPASLARRGTVPATTVIAQHRGSLNAPTGLAFDRVQRLWVANHENGTLVRYDPEQLAVSGAPAPAVVVSGLGHPTALAFDASGSLWVTDNLAATVSGYRPEQLTASGSPAPAVVLSAVAGSLLQPAGLAFDASGNLWIANIGGATLVAFTPAQLATTGSPVPAVVLRTRSSAVGVPLGLAFDGGGGLWVSGAPGNLVRFARNDLVTGEPEPSVRIGLPDHSGLWNVAFWPAPRGLPLR